MKGIEINRNLRTVIIFLVLSYSSLGTTARQNVWTDQPYFEGNVFAEVNKIDSLVISSREDCFWWGSNTRPHIKVIPERNGRFNFTLLPISKPLIMRIIAYRSGRPNQLCCDFYVEPGDRIRMDIIKGIHGDSLNFDGVGSAKYSLAQKLTHEFSQFNASRNVIKLVSFDTLDQLDSKLSRYAQLVNEFSDRKQRFLEKYKLQIKPDMLRLLEYEYANYFASWDTIIDYLYRYKTAGQIQIKNLLYKYYLQYKGDFYLKVHDIAYLAPKYLIYISQNMKLSIYMAKGKVDVREFYDIYKANYNGMVRERLLADYFVSPFTLQYLSNFNAQVFDSLLTDANHLIKTAYIKNLLSHSLKYRMGMKFYNSSFIGLDDEEFHTSSLSGKVFIFDMWSVGCTGCAEFHRMFEKDVYEKFKDNKDFVFLSVNVDKSKHRWIFDGIKSGRYTSEDYINVYTGGQEINHPLAEYYGLNALPFILLVDRSGNVITRIKPGLSSAELIDLIETALSAKQIKGYEQ